MENRLRKESVIACLFLIAILLPVFDMWLKLDRDMQLNENLKVTAPPKLGYNNEFRSAYAKYFNENFGFRNSLIRANFIIRHDLLGSSPSKRIIFGKSGWLFYNDEGEIEDYRGIRKFDDITMGKWAKSLEMKRIFLEQRGIRYLFVIAPNKSSIYGEFLPDAYNRVRERTALDELIEYLKNHTKVEVVDIRQALLVAKTNAQVYYKTDSHWNDYGAFIAYSQIMKQVVRWFPALNFNGLDDYLIERKSGNGMGLAVLIGGTEFIKEDRIKFKPLNKQSLEIENIDNGAKSYVEFEQKDPSLPRALIFRDSFFSSLAPLLAEHFQFSRYYWGSWRAWTPIDKILIVTKPDIVIEETVERLVNSRMADFVGNPPSFIVKK